MPKPRFQNMKCMNVRGLEAYQGKRFLKNFEESLKNKVWSERDSVWEMNKCGQIERDQRNENRIMKNEYIGLQ